MRSRIFLQGILCESLYGAPRAPLQLQNRFRKLPNYSNWVTANDRKAAWSVLDYLVLADFEADLKTFVLGINCKSHEDLINLSTLEHLP